MKNIKMKSLMLTSILAMAMTINFTGCGNKNANSSNPSTSPASNGAGGSVTAVGSSALQPLVEKAARDYMVANKGAKIQVQGGGSGTGLTQVSQGAAQIGNSDIFAEEKLTPEQSKELVDHKVAVVGFATIVNPKVSVDNLTLTQLKDIFTGKVTNWKEVGGQDQKIVIINRPKSSGTRATFKKYALGGAEEAEGSALTNDSSGTVRKTVAETEGAISYLSISYVDKNIKALKLDGVEASASNITTGKYPVWSYEHMYTKGEPKDLTKSFLDYMLSDDVQKKLVPELGYIPVSDMKVTREK